MDENEKLDVCSPPPWCAFDKYFDESAGAVSNAVTQEMEYWTASEYVFQIQVDRMV